jgi:hypothetical protein
MKKEKEIVERKRKSVKFEKYVEAYLKRQYPKSKGWHIKHEHKTHKIGKSERARERIDFKVWRGRRETIAVEVKNVKKLNKANIYNSKLDAKSFGATECILCISYKTATVNDEVRKYAKNEGVKIVRLWGKRWKRWKKVSFCDNGC